MSQYWDERRVLVTGGASFIGSHIVEKLIEREVKKIRVVDDLSSGKLENIQKYIDAGQVEFTKGDLLKEAVCVSAAQNIDTIFHLAADHGGRGYVDLHQVACATNLALDNLLYQNAHKAGVEQIVFASSGCVYPNYIQTDTSKELFQYTGQNAEITMQTNMPTGPMSRVADNSLAKKLLGWGPTMLFDEGLKKTIDWYFNTKNIEEIKKNLDLKLTER